MVDYMPLLKAKPGEFLAWRNVDHALIPAVRPLFEIAPTHGEDKDLEKAIGEVTNNWPGGSAIIDAGALDQTIPIAATPTAAIKWMADQLVGAMPFRPVFRLDDPPPVLADVRDAAAIHGDGAVLRWGSAEDEPEPGAATGLIGEVLAQVNLAPPEIDLLIDLWAVQSALEVAGILPTAVAALAWADAHGPWRSVTVASGAFPLAISHLQKDTFTGLARHDAELYDRVMGAGPPMQPDFGDYGVNNPALPAGGRGPLPNLRYTNERAWQVYRASRALPGNQSFFTLCAWVVGGPHWPATGAAYSWGDSEVARCATSTGGAGTATQWRAYGTSHHLAHVADRLATLGVP